MFRKKITFLFILCISMVLFLNSSASAKPRATKDDLYGQIEIFSDAIAAIQHDYVEEVAAKDIIYGALKGMLSSLDPYSQFMDPEIYKELQVETEGEFGGLGIEITIRDNLLTIISPLDGTPADKAGLKALDRIVRIDDKITKDFTLTEAVRLMRGKPGTDVTLTILRESEDMIQDVTITRDIIEIKPVRKSELLNDNIGYIKLTDFSEKTKTDLKASLVKMEKEGMDSLILDLRNNPGGLLISSVETASEFLSTGRLIVSTKGRNSNISEEFKSTGKSNFRDIPLIVMINGGSASASEIVAGAIQDHKRGIILGTKSFGKGSVQTVIPLRDGSALRLTTAKYYTPSGKTINEDGVTPDVTVALEIPQKLVKEDAKAKENIFDRIEKEENGKQKKEKPQEIAKEKAEEEENIEEDSEKQKKDDKEEEKEEPKFIRDDNQLQAAINLMQGIKVFKATQN